MDKEQILAALYNLQDGSKDAGHFHNELETVIGILVELDDSIIETAWKEICEDVETGA